MNQLQRIWILELTEDELIALSRACCEYTETRLNRGHMTLDELTTIDWLSSIDDKFPEEEWFSPEVRA